MLQYICTCTEKCTCTYFRVPYFLSRHVFSDDPLDVVQTVPFSPAPGDDSSLKKAPPRLSLWMSECCLTVDSSALKKKIGWL